MVFVLPGPLSKFILLLVNLPSYFYDDSLYFPLTFIHLSVCCVHLLLSPTFYVIKTDSIG